MLASQGLSSDVKLTSKFYFVFIINFFPCWPTGYGSDYEDESMRYPAPNGMIPGSQGSSYGPDSDRIHRDSPPNAYNQQIVPGNLNYWGQLQSFDDWDYVR